MANMGIEVEVFKDTDPFTPLGVIERRREPTILREVRAHGAGSFKVAKSDPKLLEDPTLLRYRNFVRIKDNGKVVGGFIIQTKVNTIVDEGEKAEEAYLISGEGLRAWSRDAGIHPAGGLKTTSRETRYFNFASERGPWYRDADWANATIQAPWNTSKHSRYTAPANWPDAPSANWIWDRDIPEWDYPVGSAYIRREFKITEKGQYSFFFAVDDTAELYMDGELIHTTAEHAWEETTRQDFDLDVGDHVLALKASNSAITIGPASLIGAFFQVGSPGAPTAAKLMFVTDSQWLISAYPQTVPGWTPGNILLTLIEEAKARGVRFAANATPTFTHTHDSSGVVWANRIALSFSIGSSTLEDAIAALEESACDIYLDPETLQLHAIQRRGVDRSIDKTWIEKTRNLFRNPLGKDNGIYMGPDHLGTSTWRTDMTGTIPTAIRWTRTASGSAQARPIILGADTPHEGQDVAVRVRVRLSHATTINVSIRPDVKSGAVQSDLGNVALSAGVSELTIKGKTYSGPTTKDAGVVLSVGASQVPVGGYIDATAMMVVESSSIPAYFDGNTANTETTRYRWTGKPEGTQSVYETLSTADPVVLRPAYNLIQAGETGQAEIVNSLMLRTAEGWSIEVPEDSSSKDLYGTVEGQISTELSTANAKPLVSELFTLKSLPEKAATFVLFPREGSTPVVDFLEGDFLSAPGEVPDILEKRRVMSISVSEGESGASIYAVEFDTIFKDSQASLEKYLQRQANSSALGTGFTNSSGTPSTPTKGTPPAGLPQRAPDAPTGLVVSTVGRWAESGHAVSDFGLVWNAVTTSRGTPISDVEKYEIWGKKSSELNFALLRTVFDAFGYLSNFNPGETWDFRVRTYARTGGYGPFTAVVSLKADPPLVPLPKPSAPNLVSELGVVAARWDGILGDAPAPSRYKTMELQRSNSETGTYATVASFVTGSGLDSSGIVGTEYWYRFVAVDYIGVRSPASDARKIKVAGVSTAELDDAINEAINGANATANAALISANGKGRNIYGTATQRDTYGPFNEFDIWYDTANGNRMSRWDPATSKWVTQLLTGSALSGKAIDFSKIADEVTDKINKGISDASDAQGTANTALESANGKGRNIYGTAAQRDTRAPFTVFDTWFDTANGNRPNRWTGTAWVTATPGRDALGEDVIQSISDAYNRGDSALTTANGKNSNTYSTNDPSGNGVRQGDLWYKLSGDLIVGVWTWTGTAWAKRTIDGVTLDNLDAGKITAGIISSDRITAASLKADLIGADKLLVGNFTNLLEDSSFEVPDLGAAWVTSGQVNRTTVNPRGGGACLRVRASTAAFEAARQRAGFRVEPGEKYLITGWVRMESAGMTGVAGGIELGVLARNTPTSGNVFVSFVTSPANLGTTYTKITGTWEVPDNIFFAFPRVVVRTDTGNSNVYLVDDLFFQKQQPGELIVNGAITALQMKAGTITAESGIIGSIDAGKITVGELDGSLIKAASIQARQIVMSDFTNLMGENYGFEYGTRGWAVSSAVTVVDVGTSQTSVGGTKVLQIAANASNIDATSTFVDTSPKEIWYVECLIRKTTSGTVGTIGLQTTVRKDGTVISYPNVQSISLGDLTAQNTWRKLSGFVEMPDGANQLMIRLTARSDVPAGQVIQFDNVVLRKAAQAELIVDGAVTARTMKAGTITAESAILADASVKTATIIDLAVTDAKISNINAGKITAGFIDTDRLDANSIRAEKLLLATLDNQLDNPNFLPNTKDTTGWTGWDRTAGAWSIQTSGASTIDRYLQRDPQAGTTPGTVTNTFRVAVRAGQRVRCDLLGYFTGLPGASWVFRRRNYVSDPNSSATNSLTYLSMVDASRILIGGITPAIRLTRSAATGNTRTAFDVGRGNQLLASTPTRVRFRIRASRACTMNVFLRPNNGADSTGQTTVASNVAVPAGITTQIFEATTTSTSFTANSALMISFTDGQIGDTYDILSMDVAPSYMYAYGPSPTDDFISGDSTFTDDGIRTYWSGEANASQTVLETRSAFSTIGPVFYAADGKTEVAYQPKYMEGTTAWTAYSWETNVPAGAYFASLRVSDIGYTGVTNRWANMQLRVMGAAQLLVDGEIEARHIRANSITGDRIKAGTISVDQLEPNIGDAIKLNGNAEINAIKRITDSQQDTLTSYDQRITEANSNITSAAAAASAANSGVAGLVDRADQLQAGISTAQSAVDDMGRTYRFTEDGAYIGSPGSAYEFVLQNTGAEIRYNGVPVSSWDAGRMIVDSFVGNEVVLGNHKLEKDAATSGTVVRKIAS